MTTHAGLLSAAIIICLLLILRRAFTKDHR
jgi:hypothetical protein